MINNIKVSNFQSHKNTELELHEGVNCIIGSTDSGKSALLKALYWLIYNRPQGYSFASHWIVEDEKLIDYARCILKKNDLYISRDRNQNSNLYYLFEQNQEIREADVYEALRGEVPAEVQKSLNITDVNIQKQMDAPFLLSESAGEVAKFFNRVVNLDKIDIVLKAAEASKRKNKSEIQNTDNEIQKLSGELKEYDWIEEAEKLVNRLELLTEKENNYQIQQQEIEERIEDLKYLNQTIERTENIKEVEILLNELLEIESKHNELVVLICGLENNLKWYETNKQKLDESKNLNEAEKLITEIEKLNDDLYETDDLHFTFTNQLQKVNTNIQHVGMYSKEVEILEKQLPDVCPLCFGTGRLK